jgi:Carboxypeptidase regulatory-like domain/TonB dependent receptor
MIGRHYNKWMFFGILCLAALIAIPIAAQLPTGTILGVAKDSSGGVLPNATITITNVDTSFKRTVSTADDGSYRVPELPVGHYEVRGEHSGFKTETQRDITLQVTDQAVINFTFEVGSSEQQVTVSAEVSVVNTQDATLGGLVTETAIKDLPLNGRNYVDLTLLQPGVTKDKNIGNSVTGGGGGFGTTFSVNGAPDRSNNFTLDGAVLQNQFARNPSSEGGTTLGVEGIKEYKVITTNFQAEYGVTMGSQTVMVSSNGTNQFHGDVFYFVRNAALDAKNFFDLPNTPIPQFQKNNFGGTFGGPIKKDKTFFFVVYEGLRQNQGVTNLLNVPSPGCRVAPGATITQGTNYATQCPELTSPSVTMDAGIQPFVTLYPSPNLPAPGPCPPFPCAAPQFGYASTSTANESFGQIRFDHNFSDADSAFARYTIDDDALDNAPTQNAPYFRSGTNQRNQYITLSENHIFSPQVLNTARFSFSRTKFSSAGISQGLPANPPIISGFPVGEIQVGGYDQLGPVEPLTYGTQNIYALSDDVTFSRGKHAFKFGTLLMRWNEGTQGANSQNGFLSFPSPDQLFASTPSLVEFMPPTANENRDYIYNTLGFYAQDDWRMSSHVTWNLGLRYEFMTTPWEKNGRSSRLLNDLTDAFTVGPTIENNTKRDFSPRIGVAWDVFGNGRTAVRAGFGIYYDIGNIGTTLKQDSIGNPPFAGLTDIFSAGTAHVDVPLTSAILNTQSNITPQFVDYHSKSPYMIQYNLSIQQQLPWGVGLGLAYVGNRGVHLFTIRDSNPIAPTSTGPCGDPSSRCVNGVVPFWDTGSPNYHPINPNMPSTINIGTGADSTYNGLQVVINKRVSRGLEFQVAYTYSKVMDDTQGQANVADCFTSFGLQGTYPLDPHIDRGPACFDSTNNLEASVVYHFPTVGSSNSFVSKAANGWWISSIVSKQSGYPVTPLVFVNRSNSGVLQGQSDEVVENTPALIAEYWHPALCTSQPGQPAVGSNPCPYVPIPFNAKTVVTGNLNQYFNPAMFSMAPEFPSPEGGGNFVGQLGNAGRNILRGPGSSDWNFSLVKDTKVKFLGEGGSVQFRAEFFNVLNHPTFKFGFLAPILFVGLPSDTGPFSEAPRSTGSQIRTTDGDPRQIQFAIKVLF